MLPIALVAALLASAPERQGYVVRVIDGDTVVFLANGETMTVRLHGIDAPERRQAFGRKATAALRSRLTGRRVSLVETGGENHRSRRTIGLLFVGNESVNASMIGDGWAWHSTRYSTDAGMSRLHHSACAARTGLWADPAPIPPWEYRRAKAVPRSGTEYR
jgi:micrococcal nuclease